jgi:hypothetical protein
MVYCCDWEQVEVFGSYDSGLYCVSDKLCKMVCTLRPETSVACISRALLSTLAFVSLKTSVMLPQTANPLRGSSDNRARPLPQICLNRHRSATAKKASFNKRLPTGQRLRRL